MISSKADELIKSFEGLYLKRYLDCVGVPTIGWGSIYYFDGGPVPEDAEITQEQAQELYLRELTPKEVAVRQLTRGLSLTENQIGSLVSFAYNLGVGSLKASTLLKKIKADADEDEIRFQWMRWNKAGGKVVAGLTRRRKAEVDLYFS